jgi:hypothetical protein
MSPGRQNAAPPTLQYPSILERNGSVDILLPDSEFVVARLFRGEGFPLLGRKTSASEEAGYSDSRDRSEDVNRAKKSEFEFHHPQKIKTGLCEKCHRAHAQPRISSIIFAGLRRASNWP